MTKTNQTLEVLSQVDIDFLVANPGQTLGSVLEALLRPSRPLQALTSPTKGKASAHNSRGTPPMRLVTESADQVLVWLANLPLVTKS